MGLDFQAAALDQSKQNLVDASLLVSGKVSDTQVRDAVAEELSKIAALSVSDRHKLLLLSAVLIDRFGEETVQSPSRPSFHRL